MQIKNSNIDWIGDIPTHWNVIKGRYAFTLLNRPVLPDDEIITCFRDGEVTLRKNRREDGFTMADYEYGYQGIETGDLIIHGMDGFAGAIGISDSRGKGSPILNVLDTQNCKKYMVYYLRSLAYSNVFVSLFTGIRVRSCDLRWKKIADLPILVPPLSEQTKIATFLDSKTSEIKSLIDNLNKQIESLKEYKKSLIYKCVTKGLDDSVPLKDSGIEWMGQIPFTWDTVPLKDLFYIYSGATPRTEIAEYWDGDIAWITPSDFKTSDKYVKNGVRNISQLGYESCSTTLIKPGNIIFSKVPIGSVAINANELCTNQGCFSCVTKGNISTLFYYYFLSICTEQFELRSTGTTFKQIYVKQFANFKLILPTYDEQKKIADYLDTQCTRIDNLISSKQSAIEKLNEYKKSLIYEYVTGKKEVV